MFFDIGHFSLHMDDAYPSLFPSTTVIRINYFKRRSHVVNCLYMNQTKSRKYVFVPFSIF